MLDQKQEKRFQSLLDYSRQSIEDLPSFLDDAQTINALSEEKKNAWKRLISSIATVESIENVILHPVAAHFKDYPLIQSYLDSHAKDEAYHADLFTQYVENCFQYRKTKRSVTDAVIYDRLFPFLAKRSEKKPTAFTLAVYFYEKYSYFFYAEMRKCAYADGLPGLGKLIESVEKDERRHLAGMDAIFRYLKEHEGITLADKIATQALLRLLLLDINQSPWAVYNRQTRKNIIAVGIDPDYIQGRGQWTLKHTLELLEEK